MNITKIGTRGVFFTFEDQTSVYLINAKDKIFLCDTHYGPESMEHIKQYIKKHQLEDKELIIFNSHSDYDHIWGNCAFKDATIIGHTSCRRRMEERGEFDLEIRTKYQNGKVEIKLPNLTFDSLLHYEDDGVEFIYAPGHTVDSAICFDRKDSVVFVGDLLEYPIPFLLHYDLEAFIRSLEFIRNLSAKYILSAHSGEVDEKLLFDNLTYIMNVLHNRPVDLEEKFMGLHKFNTKHVLYLAYEKMAREKLGEKFDYRTFVTEFWMSVGLRDINQLSSYMQEMDENDLEKSFEEYINRL